MALEKVALIKGRAVPVPGDDMDTDRIIPARFMKCVTFDGLGEYLFYDVRFEGEEAARKSRNHPLDQVEYKGATILISGNNFGCGSSREHAPQALQKFGMKAVIAGSFAEIFFGNCTGLGIPCVTLSATDRAELCALLERDRSAEVQIDLLKSEVRCAGKTFNAGMPNSARQALTEGQWDPIGLLLDGRAKVEALDAALFY